jgi:uncharacterized protein
VDLEAFELVLLRTPENAPAYDDAELARIQAEHLAHHARLRESGQVVTNGPVMDQPDVSLRGGGPRPHRVAGGGVADPIVTKL